VTLTGRALPYGMEDYRCSYRRRSTQGIQPSIELGTYFVAEQAR
jgi:hypothetical protein